jgi:hypothetical protein
VKSITGCEVISGAFCNITARLDANPGALEVAHHWMNEESPKAAFKLCSLGHCSQNCIDVIKWLVDLQKILGVNDSGPVTMKQNKRKFQVTKNASLEI